MGSSITGTKEESKTGKLVIDGRREIDVPWIDHVIDELVTETPHLQADSDRN